MSPLHIAVSRMQPAIIELLLMNKKTDVNIHSPLHGTPLHTACRTGSLKIVQQLLLNKANIAATCEVIQFVDGVRASKQVTPKEVTKDKRIIRLIEKYEQRLKTGKDSPLKDEEIKLYGPLDSFANAPLQDEKTRPGQLIPIKDMLNEEQYKNMLSISPSPKGENSMKLKLLATASQAQAPRARSTGSEESGGQQTQDPVNGQALRFI